MISNYNRKLIYSYIGGGGSGGCLNFFFFQGLDEAGVQYLSFQGLWTKIQVTNFWIFQKYMSPKRRTQVSLYTLGIIGTY